MTSARQSWPLRMRLFSAVDRRGVRADISAWEMVRSRRGAERLLASPIGHLVFGRTAGGVEVDDLLIADFGPTRDPRADPTRLHVHRPSGTPDGARLPVVINFHGGGWCHGSPEQSEWIASSVAAEVGALVISPAYRRAPEFPYPAAHQDALAVYEWVKANCAELGGDPARIVVMGDSAGGNLAAYVAIEARNRGDTLLGQVLVYPVVEVNDIYDSEIEFADGPLLRRNGMRNYSRLYLGDAIGTTDWQVSPIRAESLAGLAPALVVSAGTDPLRDNSRRYVERLRAEGTPAEFHEYADAFHGFISIPGVVPAAARGRAQIIEFVTRITQPRPASAND